MQQEILQGFLRIGVLVGGGGVLLLLVEPRNSPQWVVSLCSASIGLTLIGATILISRHFR